MILEGLEMTQFTTLTCDRCGKSHVADGQWKVLPWPRLDIRTGATAAHLHRAKLEKGTYREIHPSEVPEVCWNCLYELEDLAAEAYAKWIEGGHAPVS